MSVDADDERIADVLARLSDAVFAIDGEHRITFRNERADRLFETEGDDLRGAVVWEVFRGDASDLREACERASATQESTSFETHHGPLDRWFEFTVHPSETGLSVHARDVTDRIRREEELRDRERALRRAYELISDPSLSLSEQIEALLDAVRETVGTDYATLSRIDGDRYEFEFVHAPDDADLRSGDTVPLSATNCERVVERNRTLVLDDVARDAPDLADRAGNAEWGIGSYLGAPVVVDGEAYGTFCFYGMEARDDPFTDWEVTFVDLLSRWVSGALAQRRRIEQLTVLNELYEIARGVTDTVIDQSNRETIEAGTCSRLAESNHYSFAWIGTVDQRRSRVVPRASAGLDGVLDDLEIGYDDAETDPTPIGEAIRTEEMQVVHGLRERSEYGVWHERAEEYGFDSWAVTPITHEGSLHGVLNVYSSRPDAFTGPERSVIEGLGELVGHGITAAQREEALMSDAVVEVEFGVENVFAGTAAADAESDPIVFDRTVPIGDGNYLVYGGTTERGIETLRAASGDLAFWDSMEVIGERGEERRFELAFTDPPVASAVAARGGRVESARIEDGDYRLTVHLPRSADVQAIVDAVREAFPDASVLAQRQTTAEERSEARLYPNALEELTDRQLAAVESAFYAGFFEWPRDVTGEEIATSWGVSPPTFHQHLREAQRKILAAVLADDEGD